MHPIVHLRKHLREKYLRLTALERVNVALSRAAATSGLRSIDPTEPLTWEFGGFSQNQEDGIIDFLCRHLRDKNRYFIEIGAGTGLENNTTWLAIALRYSGLMVEGNPVAAEQCWRLLQEFALGVTVSSTFVEPPMAKQLAGVALHRNPDFLSLDIDGIDYFVLSALMEAGIRPKIVAVEYNSVYGPDRPQTIVYRPGFNYFSFHNSGLYYGVSIAGWRRFFDALGYQFVTVDSNGVNAFFIDPSAFEETFAEGIQGRGDAFRENFYQWSKYRVPWERQVDMIRHLDFHDIT
jgi:hypothetical protein